MITHVRRTVLPGDVVAAVFDEAAPYSSNPREVSRLTAMVVGRILRRGGRNRSVPDLRPAARPGRGGLLVGSGPDNLSTRESERRKPVDQPVNLGVVWSIQLGDELERSS